MQRQLLSHLLKISMTKTTEAPGPYEQLESMPVGHLLAAINAEDAKVAAAVGQVLPAITAFVEALIPRMKQGGRLFYLGAGTSGRLGIVDASECPPTFGVAPGRVVGIIAGGDGAIRAAVEFAEDDTRQGWQEVMAHHPTPLDSVVGITASGSTPYVLGAVAHARAQGLLTAGICCNAGSALSAAVHHPIEVVVGPEFVTGSTRMKAGTAQKMVLNMISTAAMIGLGHVRGNRMVDMQLSNHKLIERGTRMVMEATGLPEADARVALLQHGSVRAAIDAQKTNP